MVTQDGKPIRRGLTRLEAERHADYVARGYFRHRANEKRRVAEFDIKPDTGMMKELDELWVSRKD